MQKKYDFIRYLNEYQKEAVLDESRATLVNAHVGSGKTTVLISKVLYLSVEKNIDFHEMVVLTFTNKAANEIKERIRTWFPRMLDADMPYIGTFHHVAAKLLAETLPIESLGYSNDFTILDPDEMEEMANRLIIEHRLNIKYYNKLTRRIEQFKRGKKLFGKMKYEDDIAVLWKKIEAEKRAQNKLDFDDLIDYATTLLKASEFRPKWIIVDEFQDCDEAQLELIKKMTGTSTKLFVVGDANQVIYSWRGSDEKVFEKFKLHFHAKEVTLPINYRSTATILDAARVFLSADTKLEGIRNHGNKIQVKNHYNPFNEAYYLSEKIKELVDSGFDYKEIAILYRTQRQARVIEDVLRKEEIPTEISVKKTLNDIPVLRWFVSLLKASLNENDKNNIIASLKNNEFGEGLTFSEIRSLFKGDTDVSSTLFEKITQFKSWSEGKRAEDASDIAYYFEVDNFLSPTSATYSENKTMIEDFLTTLKEFIGRKELPLFDGLLEFVNTSTLYGLNILEETANLETNSVKLMTLHACKGLEFKKVFIVGVNHGLIPLRTKSTEEYEEEKRLFFVGITRAKDELEISYYTNPDEHWVTGGPSPFLSMLPSNLIELDETARAKEVDMRGLVREIVARRTRDESTTIELVEETDESDEQLVRHKKYGEGVVIKEDENAITVEFQGYGKKTFSKLFVELEYLG